MNSLTKLLLATVVVGSFAAPALALDYNSNGLPLQERNEGLYQQRHHAAQSRDWRGAYAMDRRANSAYGYVRGYDYPTTESTAGRGADAINGGG